MARIRSRYLASIASVLVVVSFSGSLGRASRLASTAATQGSSASPPSTPQSDLQKLLTVADVEGAAHKKGIKAVPGSAPRGGVLNFTLPNGWKLLMVTLGPSDFYDAWKQEPGFLNAAVTGVGDEAMNGPASVPVPYVLAFRAKQQAVMLSSYLDPKLKPLVSEDVLRTLAKVILSRL
jgi:hypothetical protein